MISIQPAGMTTVGGKQLMHVFAQVLTRQQRVKWSCRACVHKPATRPNKKLEKSEVVALRR